MDYKQVYDLVESYLINSGFIKIIHSTSYHHEIEDDTGFHILSIPSKSKYTATGIIGLLHEAGHAFCKKGPFNELPKTSYTNKAIILEREYEAWKEGRKILKKLKLKSLDSEYCLQWSKCWNTYIEFISNSDHDMIQYKSSNYYTM